MSLSYPGSTVRAVAKLYFRYGTMDSAKSLNLLAVAHNYRKQGKRVMLMKPRLDTRFGAGKISSRAGLEADEDRKQHIEPEPGLVPGDAGRSDNGRDRRDIGQQPPP